MLKTRKTSLNAIVLTAKTEIYKQSKASIFAVKCTKRTQAKKRNATMLCDIYAFLFPEAAADRQHLSRDIAAFRKHYACFRYLRRQTYSAHRHGIFQLLHFTCGKVGIHFGIYNARRNAIDAHVRGGKLLGERFGKSDNRALGGGIGYLAACADLAPD